MANPELEFNTEMGLVDGLQTWESDHKTWTQTLYNADSGHLIADSTGQSFTEEKTVFQDNTEIVSNTTSTTPPEPVALPAPIELSSNNATLIVLGLIGLSFLL